VSTRLAAVLAAVSAAVLCAAGFVWLAGQGEWR
jgi:hypothetical protein